MHNWQGLGGNIGWSDIGEYSGLEEKKEGRRKGRKKERKAEREVKHRHRLQQPQTRAT